MEDEFPGDDIEAGATGDDVKKIQQRLGVQQTGLFGPTTENFVKAFQAAHGLEVDGIVGEETWDALFTAPALDNIPYPGTILQSGSVGDNVILIQKRLGVQQTGVFGPTTEETVSAFQKSVGLEADGEVGPNTWNALFTKPADSNDLSGTALKIANTLIGVHEQPLGSNKGPEVSQYLIEAGASPGDPWCMAFVYHCVKTAASQMGVDNPMENIDGKASCSAVYNWAKANNKLVSSPRPGDIFLCIGGTSGHYHTGFVAGPVTDDDRYMTIEGNSNNDGSANGVAVVERSPGRLVASCNYARV